MTKVRSHRNEPKSDLMDHLHVTESQSYLGSDVVKIDSKSGYDRFGDFVQSGELAYFDMSKAENAKNFIDSVVSCLSVGVPCAGIEAKKALNVGFYRHSMMVREIKSLLKMAGEITGKDCGKSMRFLSNELSEQPLFPITHHKGREQFIEGFARKCQLIVCDAEPFVYPVIGSVASEYEGLANFVSEMKAAGKAILILDSGGVAKNICMWADSVFEFNRPKKTGRSYLGGDLVMVVKKSPRQNLRGQNFVYSAIRDDNGHLVWDEYLQKKYSVSYEKKRIESVVSAEDDVEEIVVCKSGRQ